MSEHSNPVDDLVGGLSAMEPLIREHADQAEQNRCLSDPVMRALARAGLFRMCIPGALGGMEVTPLTFYRVVEEVSRMDGSTGWCVFISGATPLSGAYLPRDAATEIFAGDPMVITGGSVAPVGEAVVCDGGYTVSGRWPYGSGSQHCTWLFGMCQVIDDGARKEIRAVYVPRDQVTILDDTWRVSGLAGTGSHDFTVDQVFVPASRTWTLGPGATRGPDYDGPLYRFPFVSMFRLPVSAVALGIARNAIDVILTMARSKRSVVGTGVLADDALIQARIAEAVALVRSGRTWLHAALEHAWDATVNAGETSLDVRADLLLAAVTATGNAAAAVEKVYSLAGGTANYSSHPLQRALRDVRAVTQHVGVAPQQYSEAGRMLLGQQPIQPMLLL